MNSATIIEGIKKLVYKIAPANPSGQDQIMDHFIPHCAESLFLLTIPKVGIYLGLIPAIFAIWKELWEDKHYMDFFGKNDGPYGGADGRCDLFFRVMGSVVAYMTLLWR